MANLQKQRELTNYEQWQLEKHGNVLKEYTVSPSGEIDVNRDELTRLEEWVNLQQELQLQEVCHV